MKSSKYNRELIEMSENNLELNELQARNEFLQRKCNALMLNNKALTDERNRLQAELDRIKSMSMFEFGNTYATNEQLEADGKAFAKALLGKPATLSDIAEEKAIADGENHYATFCGDDDL